ncbi:hypothetical protein [Streptomyces xanthochromogenes]|uniref:hypothetical protein n=1 Tax=Streptomyces xanthochromogenes TaxID=67384 RepID=UPI00167B7FCA|nr:hypothetical protein [Streptomyces xanthochromogenes]
METVLLPAMCATLSHLWQIGKIVMVAPEGPVLANVISNIGADCRNSGCVPGRGKRQQTVLQQHSSLQSPLDVATCRCDKAFELRRDQLGNRNNLLLAICRKTTCQVRVVSGRHGSFSAFGLFEQLLAFRYD